MSEPATRPAVVIAAGGTGTRMGGVKPERLLGGRRMLDYVIDWATSQSDCLALATAHGAGCDSSGLPCLEDEAVGIGPIAALASAMHFAARQARSHVMLVGCDTPFLPADLSVRLMHTLGGAGAALPRHGGRLHTMAGLWCCDPIGVTAWIAGGGRSLWGYAEQAGLVMVDWPDAGLDPFANINTPEDLAAAEVRLTAPRR